MRTSLQSALLGAAFMVAFGLSAQAQTADLQYPPSASEQTARMSQATDPYSDPTWVAPNPDEQDADIQRQLEERDSHDGGDQ